MPEKAPQAPSVPYLQSLAPSKITYIPTQPAWTLVIGGRNRQQKLDRIPVIHFPPREPVQRETSGRVGVHALVVFWYYTQALTR